MISAGAVRAIYNNEEPQSPVLQVIDLKTLTNGKIRTVLSDGENFLMGMFATQLTQLVTSGEMCVNSLISLNTYSLNDMAGKKVMIVLKVNVVQKDADKVGDPKDVVTGVSASSSSSSNAPPAQKQQQQQQQQAPRQQAPPMASYGQQSAPPSAPSYGGGGGGSSNQHGAVQRADPGQLFQPIEALNPYQNRWTIKARITSKGDMKTWNNARGSGQLFKIDLLDEKGGEIAGCFFKDAAEKFYPLLEAGQVYTFSNGRLKVANKQFNTCNSDYEITFNADADIRLCEQDNSIDTIRYSFRTLDTLENSEPNSTCDVIGIVKRCGDVSELTSKKTGNQLFKREIFIGDQTGCEVSLTLWGEKAQEDEMQWQNAPVLAIKKAKIGEYQGGITLGTLQSSVLTLNPDLPEKDVLISWWNETGSTAAPTKSLSSSGRAGVRDMSLKVRKPVSAIKDEGLGYSEKGDYVVVKGTVDYIIRKEDDSGRSAIPCYVSDPDTKFKCTESSDGSWFCERLDKTIQNPQRRYIMTCSLRDHTGSYLMTLFDDQAKVLMGGRSADELHEMIENGESDAVDKIFKEALFYEAIFNLKVKSETYNDEARIKVTCTAMQKMDVQQECKHLIEAINQFQ
jgi:replication factor A1